TAVYVANNTISTNGGYGLKVESDDTSKNLSVLVQGNDFHNNAAGVSIIGDGSGCGNIDLGGGKFNDSLGTSLGGDDFRGFTARGTSTAAAIILTLTDLSTMVPAANNIFSPGVSPGFVVDDGVEGSLTGSGQINAGAKLDDAHAYVRGLYNDVLGRT